MAALVCEICGGKLVMGSGGVATCESCGMQYSSDWMKEKIAEKNSEQVVSASENCIDVEEKLPCAENTEKDTNDNEKSKKIKIIAAAVICIVIAIICIFAFRDRGSKEYALIKRATNPKGYWDIEGDNLLGNPYDIYLIDDDCTEMHRFFVSPLTRFIDKYNVEVKRRGVFLTCDDTGHSLQLTYIDEDTLKVRDGQGREGYLKRIPESDLYKYYDIIDEIIVYN